jgi:protein tyrosine phosphatase
MNFNKNKDETYIPYDHTRVVLKALPGVGNDDYINASYINGYNREKAYIACQGPKFSTIKDFWRLIWQENVETVIMATNFFENKKRMCAEYWPQKLNTLNEYGNMIIKLTKVEDFEHHDIREFEIYYESYTRKVRHFYLKWGSDDENPIYPNTLVPVVKYIREVTETSNVPIVIHSGFGVNRTGTLILCDLALAMAKSTNEIDIYNLTKSLREQRPHMVNQMENYLLVHLVVLEVLMETENPFKNSRQENFDVNAIKRQLYYLKRLQWNDSIVKYQHSQCVTSPELHTPFVDGYATSGNYLVIPQPTEQTVTEFWKLITTKRVTHILFLRKLKENIPMWPHRSVGSATIISVRWLERSRKSYGIINYLQVRRFTKTTGIVKVTIL